MIPFVMVVCVIMLIANAVNYKNSDTISLVSHQQYQTVDALLLICYMVMFLLFRHYERDAKKNIRKIGVIQQICYILIMNWSICVIVLDYKWSHYINTTLFIIVGFVMSFAYNAEIKTALIITIPNIVLLCYFISLKVVEPRNYIFYFLIQQILLLFMFLHNYCARIKEFMQQEKIKRKNEELLRMNNQLLLFRKESEEIGHKKSRFLNTISHQLRTPLNAIMGTSQLLSLKELDAETKEAVETIQAAGENLLSVIHEFMNFNKLDIDKFDTNVVSYELSSWLEEIKNLGEEEASKKGITFHMDVVGESNIQLFGDKNRLMQIVKMFITNAVHYTKKGYVAVYIEIEEENGRVKLGIKVMDTSIGMKKEVLAHFLNPFGDEEGTHDIKMAQIEKLGRQYLFAKEMIHAMDGCIDFDTEEGKGSAFFFYVYQDIDRKKEKYHQITTDYEGKRILVADENAISMIIIKNILSSVKAEVDYAADPQMCREYLKWKKYQLILIDSDLFQKEQKEIEHLIKMQSGKNKEQVPVVMLLSGNEATIKESLKVSYLEKPVPAEQFRAIIHTHLGEERACVEMS